MKEGNSCQKIAVTEHVVYGYTRLSLPHIGSVTLYGLDYTTWPFPNQKARLSNEVITEFCAPGTKRRQIIDLSKIRKSIVPIKMT